MSRRRDQLARLQAMLADGPPVVHVRIAEWARRVDPPQPRASEQPECQTCGGGGWPDVPCGSCRRQSSSALKAVEQPAAGTEGDDSGTREPDAPTAQEQQ